MDHCSNSKNYWPNLNNNTSNSVNISYWVNSSSNLNNDYWQRMHIAWIRSIVFKEYVFGQHILTIFHRISLQQRFKLRKHISVYHSRGTHCMRTSVHFVIDPKDTDKRSKGPLYFYNCNIWDVMAVATDYHPMAPDSIPKHTIYAFCSLWFWNWMRKGRK